MKYPILRVKKTLTLAFAADDNQIILAGVELNGVLRRAVVVVPDLDSTHTATITIKDEDGYTVYTKAAIAESTTSNEEKDTAIAGTHSIVIDTSGAQTANRVFTVVLYLERGN